jgi:hypothetical protein
MMATQSTKGSLGDLPAAFMNLLNAQMKLSADLFESFTGQKLPTVSDLNKFGQQVLTPGATGCAPKGGCCTIPAPCWMPRSLGECVSHVGQCNSACIRFVVTNCDRVSRTISAQASGAQAGKVTISPPSVVLGPQERATISACVSIADNAQTGEKIEALIWLRGCKEYFFRWNVSVGTVGVDACHEIEVCDCPDYVHHWYDHFYCVRPCPTAGRTGVATNSRDTLTPANG